MQILNALAVLQEALYFSAKISAPALIAATVVGVAIALLQALMSLQDQALPYFFKLVAVVAVLLATGRWLGAEMLVFSVRMYDLIATVGR